MSRQPNNRLLSKSVCHGFVAALSVAIASAATMEGADREAEAAPADEERPTEERLEEQEAELQRLRERVDELEQSRSAGPMERVGQRMADHILIGGRGALSFFDTGSEGAFPNSEFRIDEARLHLDTRLGGDAYLFTEINYTEREDRRQELWLGELFLDLENLSRLWDGTRTVTLRLGRFDIPFGEEYLTRDAIDNPMISHSLGDIWGVDEGVAFFGQIERWDYILAVQNGGRPSLRDHHADKAIITRVGFEPHRDWRVSASAMRTGKLEIEGDAMSELWFGNGFIRAIGDPTTTSTFQADLAEIDLRYRWDGGHALAALGYLYYDDNDSSGDNSRDALYSFVETVQYLTEPWYLAGRFSLITSDDGMPIVGQAPFQTFFSNNLVQDIWRLSLASGYRLRENIIVKGEYSLERGKRIGGSRLRNRDMVAFQVAFAF